MEQMRGLIEADADPGPEWVASNCSACGFREMCWAGGAAAGRIFDVVLKR